MKYLITTIAALLLVGCGPNIHEATWTGNIELVKQLTDSNIDVNVKRDRGETLILQLDSVTMKFLNY